jgi:hypothetical protein
MTPQWITKERLAQLGVLAQRYRGLCLKEHANCTERSHFLWATPHQETVAVPVPFKVHDKALDMDFIACSKNVTKPQQVTVWELEWAIDDKDDHGSGLVYVAEAEAIATWKADDREQRSLDWKREQQAILDGTYGTYGSRFDPVARDQFMAQRPVYYLKGTGIDGMHGRPVAVVRVPSTSIYLYVDVSAAFTKATKNQRRLARRRGKPIQVQEVTVEQLCQQAVELWWNKHS